MAFEKGEEGEMKALVVEHTEVDTAGRWTILPTGYIEKNNLHYYVENSVPAHYSRFSFYIHNELLSPDLKNFKFVLQ